jgi:formate C-acetyltransferase
MKLEQWNGFNEGKRNETIDVRDFIQKNYKPYAGDSSFLAGPTDKTNKLMLKTNELLKKELKEGIIGIDTETVSGINAFKPGYMDKENETIVGFQTDEPHP